MAAGWTTGSEVGVRLYWLPLGAGDRVVRFGGFAWEAIAARLASRRPLDLYHAALEVQTPGARFVVEVAPYIWGAEARACRGVIAEGPVGSRLAGRLGLFRYELRCWRDGIIVDGEHAVAEPRARQRRCLCGTPAPRPRPFRAHTDMGTRRARGR